MWNTHRVPFHRFLEISQLEHWIANSMFKFDHSQAFVFDSFCSVVSNCPITQAHFLAESACNAGVAGHTSLIPGLGRSPGGGFRRISDCHFGNLLQHSYLGNLMDRTAWWATVCGVTKSQTGLRDWTCQETAMSQLSNVTSEQKK